jgi:uncharacterized membrane protein
LIPKEIRPVRTPDFGGGMIDLKTPCSRITRGFKKLFHILNTRSDLIEVKILLIGLFLTALAGAYLAYLLFTDPVLSRTLFSTAIIHVVGGRALGIATCLTAGLSVSYTIFYNFFLEIVIVLLAYGTVVLIMRNIIQPKLFHRAVRQAENRAQKEKTRIKKFGAVGLFLFVMFPFFMTGPVIGSIIGYLLNYRAIQNFFIVFTGTLSSIIIYALSGDQILKYIDQYIPVELIGKWGSVIIGLLVITFLIYHLKTVREYLYGRDNEE